MINGANDLSPTLTELQKTKITETLDGVENALNGVIQTVNVVKGTVNTITSPLNTLETVASTLNIVISAVTPLATTAWLALNKAKPSFDVVLSSVPIATAVFSVAVIRTSAPAVVPLVNS